MDERRATVRVYMVDEDLNVVSGSAKSAVLPPALRRTVEPMVEECKAHPQASNAHAVSEGRMIRVVPMPGNAPAYAVCIERLSVHASLLSAIDRFKLSPRERDVLLLTLEGKTAKETAIDLQLATSTVTDVMTRLFAKTGTRNKAALVATVLGWNEP